MSSLLSRIGINDVTKVDAKQIEEEAKNGGLPTPGYHHARLEGVRDFTANDNSGVELRFKIISGPAKNAEVKTALWFGSEKEKAKHRFLLFMHRLGLLTKVEVNGQVQYQPVPGKSEFYHVSQANAVDVFIDVKHREYTGKDGRKGMEAELSFEGVLSIDDKRCEKCPRDGGTGGASGSTVPAGKPSSGSGSATAFASAPNSYDDI